jgi:hypothetical protein
MQYSSSEPNLQSPTLPLMASERPKQMALEHQDEKRETLVDFLRVKTSFHPETTETDSGSESI